MSRPAGGELREKLRGRRPLRGVGAVAAVAAGLMLASAAAVGADLNGSPVKWFDADNKTIPEPAEIEENQVWDIADHTLFLQIGKLLDLGWTARKAGSLLHVVGPRQADNVNSLDEVPNSSWFTNRHFLHPMTLEQLKEGPGIARPDHSGPWEIVRGKFEGGTAGFTIKDAIGGVFVLKFDSEGNNEMGSSAEVIATKALHAAGYNVPRNSVVYFDPSLLRIGPKASVPTPEGGKRPMEKSDLQAILDNIIPQADGRLRCVASQYLKGVPVGIFDYHGRRSDDANDRVDHEHRRELRGLRVIGSWMNDADRRAANTLDMYVSEEEGRRRYVKHYLIDMGSTFGSNNLMPHRPKYGNEYVFDLRTIAASLVSLGLYHKAWEEPLPMPYPSIGYFENETFRPGKWVPTYPNPAFERATNRDGYWGAKILMSFGDDEIGAMVGMGRLSNSDAAGELARLLVERRDMIGRYWFAKVNPLDHFRVEQGGIRFADLAVDGGLESATATEYQYRFLDAKGRGQGEAVKLEGSTLMPLAELNEGVRGYEIRTRRQQSSRWSKYTRVYLYRGADRRHQIARVEREE